jgi:GAF domain-containing protein
MNVRVARSAVQTTAQEVANLILRGSAADISLVHLREGDTDFYPLAAYAGSFPDKFAKKIAYRAGQGGVSGTVAKDCVPRLVNDYPLEYPNSPFKGTAAAFGLRSLACAPMGVKGNVLGVIYLISRQPNWFTKADIERLVAVAPVATLALEHAMQLDMRKKVRQ